MTRQKLIVRMQMISGVIIPFFYGLFITGQILLTQQGSSALFPLLLALIIGLILWYSSTRRAPRYGDDNLNRFLEKEGSPYLLILKLLFLLYSIFSNYLTLSLAGSYLSVWIALPYWLIILLIVMISILFLLFYRHIFLGMGVTMLSLFLLIILGALFQSSADPIGPIPFDMPTSLSLLMTFLLLLPSVLEPMLLPKSCGVNSRRSHRRFRLVLIGGILALTVIVLLQSETYLSALPTHLFPIWQSLMSSPLANIALVTSIILGSCFRLSYLSDSCHRLLRLRIRLFAGIVALLGGAIAVFLHLYPSIQFEVFQASQSIASSLLLLIVVIMGWMSYRLSKTEKNS